VLSAALVLVLLAGVATWLVVARTSRPVPDDLARTPPIGWNDWNAYGCDVSEALIKQTAGT
jgi:alpha-galactosidase